MSAKPTPPCVRALDADGSEFWMDARGLAWRSDSSRVPELDGPPAGLHTCPGYCLECVTGVDRRNGHGMRATSSSAAPLDRAEVVRALAAAWKQANGFIPERVRTMSGAMCETVDSTELAALNRCGAIEGLSSALGLRAEFDAACLEVPHA